MDACDPARDVCAALDRKLGHVLETRMRVALVREQVIASPVSEACEWLAEALDRSPGTGAVDPLRDAVVDVLTGGPDAPAPAGVEPLPYALRRDLYARAVEAGAERLATLLRSQPGGGDEGGGVPRLPADVAEIPLGMRRTLAKGADPLLLEKLALDPDPAVIANLLRNPRLCERDVIRIAAMRPAPASTLEEVARSPRWSIRPRVRAALVRNPHCPVALAVKLLGRIPLVDLRTMRHDPDLPEATRAQLDLELARRSPTPHERD